MGFDGTTATIERHFSSDQWILNVFFYNEHQTTVQHASQMISSQVSEKDKASIAYSILELKALQQIEKSVGSQTFFLTVRK